MAGREQLPGFSPCNNVHSTFPMTSTTCACLESLKRNFHVFFCPMIRLLIMGMKVA